MAHLSLNGEDVTRDSGNSKEVEGTARRYCMCACVFSAVFATKSMLPPA